MLLFQLVIINKNSFIDKYQRNYNENSNGKKKRDKYSLINYIGKSNVLLFSMESPIIIYCRYFLLRNP